MPTSSAMHAMAMIGCRLGRVISRNGFNTATAPATNTATGRRVNAIASHATDAAHTASTTANHNRWASSGEPPSRVTPSSRPRSSSCDAGKPVDPVPVNSVPHSRVMPRSPSNCGNVSPAARNVPTRNQVCGNTAPSTAAATTAHAGEGAPAWTAGGAALSFSPEPAVMRRIPHRLRRTTSSGRGNCQTDHR